MKESIIFIDESAVFLPSREFAEAVKGSDNYFVIVTRDSLSSPAYSIEEIYGLRDSSQNQKYKPFHKVYNESYRLYNLGIDRAFKPEKVITEDSNSGFEFYSILYRGKCDSAHGKNNVYELLRQNRTEKVLAVVDGAAFGSEIAKVLDFLKVNRSECVVFAPESFEYLILLSGLIDCPSSVTEETYRYADSCDYVSWEDFYSEYLRNATRNTDKHYSKTRLAPFHMTDKAVRMISSVIPSSVLEGE